MATNNWTGRVRSPQDNTTGGTLEQGLRARVEVILDIQGDLVEFGLNQGFNPNQVRNAVEDLFSTFVTDWVLFVFTSSDSLSTAIGADVTLGWLDLDANGIPLRQRLINRLS